jgi:hypothetical protein
VEGEMTEQVKKNKPHYPTEPFVKKYERHVEKWGEILEDPNRVNTKWNVPIWSIGFWLGDKEIWKDIIRLTRSSRFMKCGKDKPLRQIVSEVQTNEHVRKDVQRCLFESYIYIIENWKDLETECGYDSEGDWYEYKVKWKKSQVSRMDRIHKSNNNPFDIIWYIETTDYKVRRIVYISVYGILFPTILFLPFVLINNRKLLFGIP